MNKTQFAVLTLAFFLFSFNLNAQTLLTEGQVEVINNVEYGYVITNTQSKDDYERYEVKFYVNNRGCTRYLPMKQTVSFSEKNQNILAEFNVTNATGKRFTNKSRTLYLSDWNYTIQNDIDGKGLIGKKIQIGYYFRKDDAIGGTEVILTPKGEKPQVKVFAPVLPD